MNPGETIVAGLCRQRKILLAPGILVTLGLALNLRHPGMPHSLDIWLMQDAPVVLEYRGFQQIFGHDEVIVAASVMLSSEGAITEQTIDELRQLLRDSPDLRGRWIGAAGLIFTFAVSLSVTPAFTVPVGMQSISGPMRQDAAAIERDIGSCMTLDYTIGHPRSLLQAEVFAQTADWQDRVVAADLAQWGFSTPSEPQRLAASSTSTVPAVLALRSRVRNA